MSLPVAFLLSVAGIGLLYLACATVAVLRLGRRVVADTAPISVAVTILKPLHGDEPGLFENLASFARQAHPGPLQIVLGLQHPADRALAVARALREAFPAVAIDIVVDARQHGTNRKVSNLINMMERARHEVIVVSDSDMRVAPDYLAGILRALAGPGTGVVTCPYHGLATGTVWSRLSQLAIDTHFLPGVAVGKATGAAEPCMGSTVALRRETLERIGGFRALADELADDYELGAAIRRLGLAVRLAPFTIGHVCPERSLADLVRQELRWQRTVRLVAPAGHLGSAITHPFAFALAALALQPGIGPATVVAAALAARLALCLAAERAFGLKPHAYWLVPARDLLSFALFLASFLGRNVSWRGRRYEVARSGVMVPKTRPGSP